MQVANKVRRRGQLGPNGKVLLPPNNEQHAFTRQQSLPPPAIRQAPACDHCVTVNTPVLHLDGGGVQGYCRCTGMLSECGELYIL